MSLTSQVPRAEDRVLVCARRLRDVELTCSYLAAAQIPAVPCASVDALSIGLTEGAAAAIIDEQTIRPPESDKLKDVLAKQPQWSDIPLVLMSQDVNSIDEVVEALGPVGNLLILERPARRRTLLSVVRTALRARARQYHTRDLLYLADADRRKNEFFATLGHELRNPLAAIRSAHELIESLAPRDPKLERPNSIIDRQLTNLSGMVDDLLDVSRVISGKLHMETQRVDLNEVVERAAAGPLLAKRLGNRTLTVTLASVPAVVIGDPGRLEQIVTNLLDNAAKYTAPDGQIAVSVMGDGPYSIQVRDDGLGITAEALLHIFEPFVQEQANVGRSQGGLGLGLPLVRGLVTLHGGAVAAFSDGPGKGSSFLVTLPRAAGEASVRRPEIDTTDEGRALGGRHVLIVEDNADLLEMLQALLEIHGASVETARDGEEGVARALAGKPEIALVDIGLPILSGYQVASRIRTGLGKDTTLIAVSGFGQLEDRRRALEAGFDEHLVKPVDVKQLTKVLLRLRA